MNLSTIGNGENENKMIVVKDLLAAISSDRFSDLSLMSNDSTIYVPAIRFVLAARSPVFAKMLFGEFHESKQTIVKLAFSREVVETIVHFCNFNSISQSLVLDETRAAMQNTKSEQKLPVEQQLIDNVQLFVEISQAADFFQLHRLKELAEEYVRRQMTNHPMLACIVLEASRDVDSPLSRSALQIIESRPYVALDPNVAYLSKENLNIILKNNAMAAGEWFLIQMLQMWHSEHRDAEATRKVCQSCIKLSYIEPARLLSLQDSAPWIPKDFIFDAIAKQALKASQFKTWRLECRGRPDDRVLVEGAGSKDVNGMYYRLSSSIIGNNDLYVKRELAGGQSFVYSLSRRLQMAEKTYECRIFRNKFLTHTAVQKLRSMQVEGTVQQSFQPILQVVQMKAPDETDTDVPTPIRKFHRLQLSDGDFFMPGTLLDTKNLEKLTVNQVIQVQEFGLYSIYNRAGIHILRAKVLGGPMVRFGDPKPSPALDDETTPPIDTSSSDHATFYTNVYPATNAMRIPKMGWQRESFGDDPPPECTYCTENDANDIGCTNVW